MSFTLPFLPKLDFTLHVFVCYGIYDKQCFYNRLGEKKCLVGTGLRRFSSRIPLGLTSSIFPLTLTSFPVSGKDKHPKQNASVIFQCGDSMLKAVFSVSIPIGVVTFLALQLFYPYTQ